MPDQNRPRVKSENLVWDIVLLDWVAMGQPVINTDILTVSSNTNITLVDGSPVDTGPGNASGGTMRVVTAANSQVNVINTPPLAVWTGSGYQFVGLSSSPVVTSSVAAYTYSVDYSGGSNPIYIGAAVTGSSPASSVWQIRKLAYDGSGNVTDIQFANGSPLFNSIWNNRTSFIYS